MRISLDVGTIDITNKEVAKFIQNRSIDEIKKMFTDFLNSQVKNSQNSNKTKGKWAKVADEMKGTISKDTAEYLKNCSLEIRNGFELRDYK